MPKPKDVWYIEQYFKAVLAPFDNQVTMVIVYPPNSHLLPLKENWRKP